LRHLFIQVGVAQHRLPGFGQPKPHPRDQRAARKAHRLGFCAGMLKDRIPVAKAALRSVERKTLARDQINRVQRLKPVLQFHAIGPDVLHRRPAYRAGYEGQILQARVAILKRPGHEVVPAFPGTGFNDEGFGCIFDQAAAHQLDFEHQRLDVAGQHNIAAAAQHELLARPQLGIANHGLQILKIAQAHQDKRLGHDVKGVVGLKRDVFLD
jgi:hypothetical protein